MNLVYDLGRFPASWDFLQWLINIEIIRRSAGGQLGVHFKAGPKDGFRDDGSPRPLDQRQAILDNVMRPALKLIGAVEVDHGCPSPVHYMTKFAVEHYNKVKDVPFFRVPDDARDEVRDLLNGRKPLVITLREALYWPERNSNIPAWIEFARDHDVIFVRDTAKADEPLEGFETSPRASRDLLFRAALMGEARCNLLVSNGPIILPMYSAGPWLNFGALRPSLNWSPGQPKWWAGNMGCPVGTQFPWCRPDQRMIWGDDTLANIRWAWAKLDNTQAIAC